MFSVNRKDKHLAKTLFQVISSENTKQSDRTKYFKYNNWCWTFWTWSVPCFKFLCHFNRTWVSQSSRWFAVISSNVTLLLLSDRFLKPSDLNQFFSYLNVYIIIFYFPTTQYLSSYFPHSEFIKFIQLYAQFRYKKNHQKIPLDFPPLFLA